MAKKKGIFGDFVSTGVGNLVGVGLIGATSDAVGALHAGTAKSVAGIVPGLQSVSLMGSNLKLAKKSLGEYW